MGLIRTVEPAEEPISLEEAKLHLRQDVDDEDELIIALIAAARQAAETHTLRALVTQTWQLKIDYDWPSVDDLDYCGQRIVLPRPPIASVTSITYIDSAGASQTLASDQYVTSKRDTGEWGIEPAYGVTWPYVREQLGAITVTFVAGVAAAALDEPIKAAIKLLTQFYYERDADQTIKNAATSLLDPYRVHPYR